MIAVASTAPHIKIFALPQPTDSIFEYADTIQAIKTKPAVLLITNPIQTTEVYPTKITWSQAKGHSLLAAGFSNGNISIWKLDTSSRLLCRKSMDSTNIEIMSLQTFVAHQEHVTALSFHHTEKMTLLASGGNDRRLKVFQLENGGGQVNEIMNSYQKSRVTSLAWSPTTFFYIYGLDTDYSIQQTALRFTNVAGIMIDNQPLFTVNSTVTDVAFNEWTHASQFVTAAGEVFRYVTKDYMGDIKGNKKAQKIATSFVDEVAILKLDDAFIGADQTIVAPAMERVVFCDIKQVRETTKFLRLNVLSSVFFSF